MARAGMALTGASTSRKTFEVLWKWRLMTPYNQSEDWVFASPESMVRSRIFLEC
jgi:hypothetical protein